MIERYSKPEMAEKWTDRAKFSAWREVEIAALQAQEDLQLIPLGTTAFVREQTHVDDQVADMINRRDKAIGHDLNAFLEVMRLQIHYGHEQVAAWHTEWQNLAKEEWNSQFSNLLSGVTHPAASFFHKGMTSYDTEEPAMSMLVRSASAVVLDCLAKLERAIEDLIAKHDAILPGRTHVQHAQPITFKVKLLHPLQHIRRERVAFARAARAAEVMKFSGAVGIYGTLNRTVETRVGKILKLRPVISTQIVALDRRAKVIQGLGNICTAVATFSNNLWLQMQTEVGELREGFGKLQKGSSAMPHKKNPILTENVRGLANLVPFYALAMQMLVATAHERDISHSAPERIIVPDAFGITVFVLQRLTGILENMEVFPERMAANLELTHGTMASQRVEMFLKDQGVPPEKAYRAVQEASFHAVKTKRHLQGLLRDPAYGVVEYIIQPHSQEEHPDFAACFDWRTWVVGEADVLALAAEENAELQKEMPPER